MMYCNWIVVVTMVICIDVSTSLRHIIYWDNGMTSTLTSDEGMTINVMMNEWMEILCPYDTNREAVLLRHHSRQHAYLKIYNVTEHEFKNCRTHNDNEPVLRCANPAIEAKLTTKFQRFSPSPGGFVFRPGQTYYYISRPLHDSSHAGCGENVMKLKVQVHHKNKEKHHSKQTIRTYHVIQTDHTGEKDEVDKQDSTDQYKTKQPEETKTTTKLSTTPKEVKKAPQIAHSRQQNGGNSAAGINFNSITCILFAISLMLHHMRCC